MSEIFKTTVTATGGRDGQVISEDGVLQLEVRIPKAMGGAGGPYTNPEQLFAAGYAACFASALQFVARSQKVQVTPKVTPKVTATVGLQTTETAGFGLTVALDIELEGVEREVAQSLLESAHAICPYSNAIRNNVDVKLNLR
ncbi:MAG: organic hydroperoxide resistance protein [Caldilineaceae bacterium]|nr:organic hydroperoxide resistance protein [Caldilineaceae bacterium]